MKITGGEYNKKGHRRQKIGLKVLLKLRINAVSRAGL